MCVKLTLLQFLQGELHWMWLENLKVRHELNKFGYYRIEKRLKLPFSKLTFPNYFERSKADTYLVTELWNLFIYGNV
jgi:hypothetical protein